MCVGEGACLGLSCELITESLFPDSEPRCFQGDMHHKLVELRGASLSTRLNVSGHSRRLLIEVKQDIDRP